MLVRGKTAVRDCNNHFLLLQLSLREGPVFEAEEQVQVGPHLLEERVVRAPQSRLHLQAAVCGAPAPPRRHEAAARKA